MTDDAPRTHLTPVPNHDGPDTRTPPHDERAERAVLGLAITHPGLLDDLHLEPSDFYATRHEWLWDQIQQLRDDTPDITPITVNTALMRKPDTYLREGGGALYLFELVEAAAAESPASARYLAGVIRNQARARHVLALGQRLTQLGYNATTDGVDLVLTDGMDLLEDALRAHWYGATATNLHADLTWVTNGQAPVVEPPQHCVRTDGHALFYAGRVNGIYGDPEAAKTWLAHTAITEALHNGQRAALIDVDHNGPQLTVERLLLLGAHPHQLGNHDLFRYLEPDDGQDLRAVVRDLVTWRPAVAVLDSIGEMFPMLGIKSVDNDEISGALRIIASPLARAGACVITIDHLPKSAEARQTGFAIGGTAKKRAIDGAYIHAEARLQPAPGHVGKITLRIEKDRPGRLREVCTGKYAGTFVIDSTTPNQTTTLIELDSPITDDGVFRPTHLMEKVSRFVEDNDQCTQRDIRQEIGSKTRAVAAAIECLIREGYLSAMPGPRNSTLHHSIATYREADDEQA